MFFRKYLLSFLVPVILFTFFIIPCYGSDKKVSIDFDNVDIKIFIKFISEVTHKNFIIDNRVKGKVTVVSPGKISIEKAYNVFEAVLDVHGFAAVASGDVVKIVSTFEARTKNMEIVNGKKHLENEDKMITLVLPLKYASPNKIKRLISPIVSKQSAVMSYDESSMIIITDYQSNINRLIKIIDAVDVRQLGREISIIRLDNADGIELAKTLKLIFSNTKRPGEMVTENKVRFVADDRTNSIIAVASKADIPRIKEIVHYLDQERAKGDEKFHVYYLKNADAENLAKVLQSITSGLKSTSLKKVKKKSVVSGDVSITADKSTNSIIIKAGRKDYDTIARIVKQLDINRPMVYLECLIAEMNMEKGLGIGAEWAVGYDTDIKGSKGAYGGGFSGNAQSPYSTMGGLTGATTSGMASFPSGFSLGVMAEPLTIGSITFPNLGAVIQAYKSDKDVNILSTPQIMTMANEKAKISVGKNIPYLIKSTTGDNAYNNYEYKDVGTVLEITPQINQDGLVKLQIFQEVTKLDTAAGSFNELPTTLKRTIQTTVVVKNEHTVVLGGLIDDSLTLSDYKVPCLGDIPILGYLFKSHGKSSDKTNLYVFITPHVVNTVNSAKKLYDLKKKDLKDKMINNMKGKVKDIPLYD